MNASFITGGSSMENRHWLKINLSNLPYRSISTLSTIICQLIQMKFAPDLLILVAIYDNGKNFPIQIPATRVDQFQPELLIAAQERYSVSAAAAVEEEVSIFILHR
jgi:hypothetical protein